MAKGEEDGDAELLHEEHQSHAEGDVNVCEHVLGHQVGGLEAAADADSAQDRRNQQRRDVVSDLLDEDSGHSAYDE